MSKIPESNEPLQPWYYCSSSAKSNGWYFSPWSGSKIFLSKRHSSFNY
ncbi:hypothetical protein SLEP1_g38383 [Rubroshorea leprosula]|nr:hypothetical protein SLEP1_g38383 [Rubroshorea leprosula]